MEQHLPVDVLLVIHDVGFHLESVFLWWWKPLLPAIHTGPAGLYDVGGCLKGEGVLRNWGK